MPQPDPNFWVKVGVWTLAIGIAGLALAIGALLWIGDIMNMTAEDFE